jgi:DNA-binding transcriptional LysR family regulator
LFGSGIDRSTIHLQRTGETADVDVPARLVVSDSDILTAVAVGGQGIALLPGYQCVEHVRARRLERVLRDWDAPSTPVHVVYPSTRHLSPKVKSFIDHLYEAMTPPPWELGPMP